MRATPSMPDPGFNDKRAKIEKSVYPGFDRSMYNYYYYSQGLWTYTIMWDWVNHRCVFGIDKKNEDPKDPNVWDRKEFINRYPNDKPSEVGETIKTSFCEKLYGLKLTK